MKDEKEYGSRIASMARLFALFCTSDSSHFSFRGTLFLKNLLERPTREGRGREGREREGERERCRDTKKSL